MQVEVMDSQSLLGERLSRELRRRYGPHAAKQAARITGSDLRTAQGWVSEHREPRGAAFLAIVRELGKDGLIALFSQEIEQHNEKMERQIHALREEAARLEARLGKGRSSASHQIHGMASEPAHDPCINHGGDGGAHGPDRRILRRRKDDR